MASHTGCEQPSMQDPVEPSDRSAPLDPPGLESRDVESSCQSVTMWKFHSSWNFVRVFEKVVLVQPGNPRKSPSSEEAEGSHSDDLDAPTVWRSTELGVDRPPAQLHSHLAAPRQRCLPTTRRARRRRRSAPRVAAFSGVPSTSAGLGSVFLNFWSSKATLHLEGSSRRSPS